MGFTEIFAIVTLVLKFVCLVNLTIATVYLIKIMKANRFK